MELNAKSLKYMYLVVSKQEYDKITRFIFTNWYSQAQISVFVKANVNLWISY